MCVDWQFGQITKNLLILIFLTTITGLFFAIMLANSNMEFNLQKSVGKREILGERLLYEQFNYEIISNHELKLIKDFKIMPQCEPGYSNIFIKAKRSDYYNFVSKPALINNITIDSTEFKFCAIYSSNLEHTYENLLNVSSKVKCSNGYIPCGILDTLGNLLCIPEGGQCPLNDIIIDIPERTDLISKGYIQNKLDATTSFYLYFGQSNTNYVIIDLVFSFIEPLSHDYDYLINDEPFKKDAAFNFLKYQTDKYYIKSKGKPVRINNRPTKFSLYSKNYIGIKDFQKYREIFNVTSYKDNPLYNLVFTELSPNQYIFGVGCFFSFFLLFPLILSFSSYANSVLNLLNSIIYCNFFLPPIMSILLGYIFIKDYYKYKESFLLIDNNIFDDIMQEVITLYNSRIMPKNLIIVTYIFGINIILSVGTLIIFFIEACCLVKDDNYYHIIN